MKRRGDSRRDGGVDGLIGGCDEWLVKWWCGRDWMGDVRWDGWDGEGRGASDREVMGVMSWRGVS